MYIDIAEIDESLTQTPIYYSSKFKNATYF